MEFERPTDMDRVKAIDGTVIVPIDEGKYDLDAFSLNFQHPEASKYRGKLDDLLRSRGEEFMEIDLETLAILVWEHRQYCDAQEFSLSTVRIHRAVQSLSENQDRFFPRDIKAHPLIESAGKNGEPYSNQMIRNGLKKLVKEGYVTEGDADGEYHYEGPTQYIPPSDVPPLNDLKTRMEEDEQEDSTTP